MAFNRNNTGEFTDAAEASKERTNRKKSPMGFMSWEMVSASGEPLTKDNGKPLLCSEGNADIALFGINGYNKSTAEEIAILGVNGYNKSKAEEMLINAARLKHEAGEVLELTFKVKIKYYDPTLVEPTIEEETTLCQAMGIFATA